jgi:Recombinase
MHSILVAGHIRRSELVGMGVGGGERERGRRVSVVNSEGVLAPQPQKGRFSRSWCISSVRHVLLNRRYIGKTIWNTKRKVRSPGTSKRVYRPRPESEWTTVNTPHLRIVSDELFAAVSRTPFQSDQLSPLPPAALCRQENPKSSAQIRIRHRQRSACSLVQHPKLMYCS